MGTGWRRAFCTSIPRDTENATPPEKQQHHRRLRQLSSPSSSPSNPSNSPRSCAKFSVFSSGGSSNPPSLRLRCRTTDASSEYPLLLPAFVGTRSGECKSGDFTGTYTPPPLASSAAVKGSPKLFLTRSNPASPRSPSRFALLKATLRLSRSRCGICSQSVRTGQRTAVFTAECSHSFHFPCISSHVRTQSGNQAARLSCPVCSASWQEVPLLSLAHSQPTTLPPSTPTKEYDNTCNKNITARIHGSDRPGETDPKQSANSKIYDDDEPLLFSSTGQGVGVLHFNTIHEDEGDGISYGRARTEGSGCGVEVVVSPETALISADRNNQNYVVLLRVKAPALPQRSVSKVAASVLDPSCRAPIDLVTVLDVSGSMTSAKLQMLKRAMRLLISSLGSSDRLSIVAFSTGAKRLLPLVRMSRQGQRSARLIVDRLIVCGDSGGGDGDVQGDCRCIGHALRKATKVLEDRRERNPVATIMLLSDSHQENRRGEEKEAENMEKQLRTPFTFSTDVMATRFAHLEIPIGCSDELGANQVEDVFSKCISGLVSLVFQDVHLQLTFPSGFISAVYSYGSAGGGGGEACVGLATAAGVSVLVKLGDFYAKERRELLVELRLSPAAAAQPLGQRLSYKCSYRDPTSRELVLCRDRTLALPPLRQISPAPSPSHAVVEANDLRSMFITTRAMAESRRLTEQNELEAASHLLSTARSMLLQTGGGAPHRQKYVAAIELRLSELHRRHKGRQLPSSSSSARASEQQLTPTSAWRAAEQLAKVAILRKSMGRVGDLHGFENARF